MDGGASNRDPRPGRSLGEGQRDATTSLACTDLQASFLVMRNIIPFRKKKQKLDWIQGITPRKEQPRQRVVGRIPPALPGGIVIAVMIAMLIWLF